MKQPVERRLAAILAADVAGYSRLMGADEEGTLDRLKAHRRELIDPKIGEHRGRIVKTTGDGMLAEFPSVVDAVRCAVEIQRGMADRNAEVPEDKRITFRIGINLGDIIVDGDDIYGDGVNIAARLEALAEPGGICISRVVRDQIRDKLPYPFADMGEQSVKNITRPVRVYAMNAAAVIVTQLVPTASPFDSPRRNLRSPVIPAAAAAAGAIGTAAWWAWPDGALPVIAAGVVAAGAIAIAIWWAWPNRQTPTVSNQHTVVVSPQTTAAAASTAAPRLSIVVLPFANLSNDPDQEYFADGITDDLTTDLSRIEGSFVIARNTAFTYKGKPVDARQIARDLGVRYVLEGSVRRSAERVQVNVQLIDGETGAHVWADRFDTDRRDLAAAQSEITSRLARTLDVELVRAESGRVERERATNPDARDFVMRGWVWLYRPSAQANYQESQRAFEQALELDPNSIEARVGLARVLVFKVAEGWSGSVEEDKLRAERLLREALDRDPNHANAHYVSGVLNRLQRRLTDARIELEKAIALGNNAPAYQQLGIVLIRLGQPEDGIPYIEKAIRLSPHDPFIHFYYWALGHCHLLLGQTDQAIDLLARARASNPHVWYFHTYLAAALGLGGDLDEARSALAESLRLKPEVSRSRSGGPGRGKAPGAIRNTRQ
jgi:adenylate cyclase